MGKALPLGPDAKMAHVTSARIGWERAWSLGSLAPKEQGSVAELTVIHGLQAHPRERGDRGHGWGASSLPHTQ